MMISLWSRHDFFGQSSKVFHCLPHGWWWWWQNFVIEVWSYTLLRWLERCCSYWRIEISHKQFETHTRTHARTNTNSYTRTLTSSRFISSVSNMRAISMNKEHTNVKSVRDTHSRPRSPALWFFDFVIVFASSAIAYHKHHTHTPFTTVPHNHTRRAYLNAYSHCMAFSRCQVIITFYTNDFSAPSQLYRSEFRLLLCYRFNSLRFVFGLDACVWVFEC